MGKFDESLERKPGMVVVYDVLDHILQKAEKAHPLLPDNIEDFIDLGFGKLRDWHGLYYMDEEEMRDIFDRRMDDWIEYFTKLREACEKLNSLYVETPTITPEMLEHDRPWIYLMYTPTTVRDYFENIKEKIKDCESVECIKERLKSE